MEIKKILENTSNFVTKRLIELFGVLILVLSVFLLISLLSYYPEDPNFIFPQNTKIDNILGFRGSIVSDLFFQSIGLVSILVSITFIITGINIVRTKKLILILQNPFYLILYVILGSLFFAVYYPESFLLNIHGNGGFVGKQLSKTFLGSFVNLNKQISFYLLVISIGIFFLISINLNIYWFCNLIKEKILKLFSKNYNTLKNNEKAKYENENFTEVYTKQIQEDLPFGNIKNQSKIIKKKFYLPSIDFLKLPTKKERKNETNENDIDQDFLEKILLDFGVEGKIKKISHGPVVTLNEFEPAPGIKVSKIINLSEDIARNTSSESARIATIPGKNTVGIELPKSSRENVYLSEIISENNFQKKDIKLPIALGKDISGLPITGDLSSMPHLLIAGTTGSGKSICINTIILSLLYRHPPDKCKFILLRSLKTLAVRMERHCENAFKIANFLEGHEAIAKIYYPGLASHPNHDVAKKQMNGFGGMITVVLKGGLKSATTFLERTKLFALAESLGGVESLIELPGKMTHASVPEDLRKELGIEEGLVRLSVGIEHPDDIIADLKQALETSGNVKLKAVS